MLVVHKASTNSLRGDIQATGERIPLYDFSAVDTQDRRRLSAIAKGTRARVPQRGGGVTYRMQGQRRRLPHAFIARMTSGHIGVFERAGKTQYPIREKFGPSLPYVFRKHTKAALEAVAESELAKNLRHEIGFLLTFGRR